jgi:hypothetical protein
MPNVNIFNVNTQACVVLVNKLEQLHKSAFPLAVRGTLNAAAFDVKTRTLDESATKNFIRRSPTFFKRFSGVNRATGWNIESMKAEVGMTAEGGGTSEVAARTAVANMEVQEEGGKIDTGLEYLNPSRIGGASDSLVASSKRWKKTNIVRGNFSKKGTTKSRMIAAAFVALNEKKLQVVMINGRKFYRQVTAISKTAKGKIKIRSKLIYAVRNGNQKPITATHFSREAANMTIPRIAGYFNEQAQKQIDRIMRS